MEENSERIWKIQKKSKLNSEGFGKYRRKISRIVKRYGQCGRKVG
jgi:hypothetical protein